MSVNFEFSLGNLKFWQTSGNFRIRSRGWRNQVIRGINKNVAMAVSSIRLTSKASHFSVFLRKALMFIIPLAFICRGI